MSSNRVGSDDLIRLQLAELGALENIVSTLKTQSNPDVLEKCFWAITNMAKNDNLRKRFAQLDILPSLIQHLKDFSMSTFRYHLLQTLINILVESTCFSLSVSLSLSVFKIY
jgi:hypothetical protein